MKHSTSWGTPSDAHAAIRRFLKLRVRVELLGAAGALDLLAQFLVARVPVLLLAVSAAVGRLAFRASLHRDGSAADGAGREEARHLEATRRRRAPRCGLCARGSAPRYAARAPGRQASGQGHSLTRATSPPASRGRVRRLSISTRPYCTSRTRAIAQPLSAASTSSERQRRPRARTRGSAARSGAPRVNAAAARACDRPANAASARGAREIARRATPRRRQKGA